MKNESFYTNELFQFLFYNFLNQPNEIQFLIWIEFKILCKYTSKTISMYVLLECQL